MTGSTLRVLALASVLLAPVSLLAGPTAGFIIQVPTATAGVPFNFTVRAIDTSGYTVPSYTGTVHFTSSDGSAVLPSDYTFTAGDAGTHTFSATLHGYTTVTLSATDVSDSGIHGSAGVTVKDPDHVTRLIMTMPANPERNASTPFQVVAENSDHQPVASYRGTVKFYTTGNDSTVDLPADYTFTAADAGSHTFSAVFHRGGHHAVVLEDVPNTGIGDLADVWVVCSDLTVSAVNNGPVCPGSSVTVSAFTNAANPSWFWQPNHPSAAHTYFYTQTAIVPYETAWLVTVTDNDTGCLATTQTAVALEPPPQIDVPSSTSGDFTATIANDPNGPYTNIQWSVTYGTIVDGNGTPAVTIRPDADATRVDVRVTATRTSKSCTVEAYRAVQATPAAISTAISTSASVCPNATGVTASVPDAGAGATYAWTINNGSIASGQGTHTITFNASGAGTVTLTVTVERNFQSFIGSKDVTLAGPSAVVSGGGEICPTDPPVVTATFSGVPPFTVMWSDGVVQNGINAFSITRTVQPDASFWITHFADSACEGTATGQARFSLLQQTAMVTEPQDKNVIGGDSATLTVAAQGDHLTYQWFEGVSGDTSRPVMTGNSTFVTPPLTHSTSYWVRVAGSCGVAFSRTALVSVAPRRRPMRH